jgi:hypothetical protein
LFFCFWSGDGVWLGDYIEECLTDVGVVLGGVLILFDSNVFIAFLDSLEE